MCVIAVCQTRGMTDREIRDAFDMNDDGAGFAWSDENNNLNFRKGFMRAADILSAYKELGMRKKLPHVVHFRNATSAVVPELTHPYIVSENSEVLDDEHEPLITYSGTSPLLFHNGVLGNWRSEMLDFFMTNKLHVPDGQWSDTRFMAILCHHLGKNVLGMLSAGKFVFMTNDIIDVIGDFTNDNGILYSNLSYKKVYRDKGGVQTTTTSGKKGGGGPLSVRYNPSSRYSDDDNDDINNGDDSDLDDAEFMREYNGYGSLIKH